MGYKFYTASEPVANYLKNYVNEVVEIIEFPKTDKRALREIFQDKEIGCVFNLARARAENLLDEDYVMRRNAIDFAIPLFNEPNTSLLFAQCLKEKIGHKASFDELPHKVEVPEEVRRWSEFIHGKPV